MMHGQKNIKINVDTEDDAHGWRNSLPVGQSHQQSLDATVTCSQNSVSVQCQKSTDFAHQRLSMYRQKITAGAINS